MSWEYCGLLQVAARLKRKCHMSANERQAFWSRHYHPPVFVVEKGEIKSQSWLGCSELFHVFRIIKKGATDFVRHMIIINANLVLSSFRFCKAYDELSMLIYYFLCSIRQTIYYFLYSVRQTMNHQC